MCQKSMMKICRFDLLSLALPHDDAMTPDMKVDWKRALYSQPRNTGKDHDDSLVETDALTSKALKVRRTK